MISRIRTRTNCRPPIHRHYFRQFRCRTQMSPRRHRIRPIPCSTCSRLSRTLWRADSRCLAVDDDAMFARPVYRCMCFTRRECVSIQTTRSRKREITVLHKQRRCRLTKTRASCSLRRFELDWGFGGAWIACCFVATL